MTGVNGTLARGTLPGFIAPFNGEAATATVSCRGPAPSKSRFSSGRLVGGRPGFDDPGALAGEGGSFGGRAVAGADGCIVGGVGGRGPAVSSSFECRGVGEVDGGAGGRKLWTGGLAPTGGGKPIRSVSFFGSFRSAIKQGLRSGAIKTATCLSNGARSVNHQSVRQANRNRASRGSCA